MDINAPITSIMSVDVLTVEPDDKLVKVKEIFNSNHIHHVPVVHGEELVGIIAQSDLKHFYRGMQKSDYDKMLENSRLNNYTAEDIMTTGLSTLSSDHRIAAAIELFKQNRYHAIPIVDDGKLVGMVTSFDIISALSEDSA